MRVFYIEQIDTFFEFGIEDNDAQMFTIDIVRATIKRFKNLFFGCNGQWILPKRKGL